MRALAARITSLLGTGPEGARYQGEAPDGRPVLLHALRVQALSPERRAELEERAALLRATSSLEVWPVLDAKFGPERGLHYVPLAMLEQRGWARTDGNESTGQSPRCS